MKKKNLEDLEVQEFVEKEKRREYVHVPGTVHLNAYESAVQEAEQKVAQAKAELEGAKQALEEKLASSEFVEVEDGDE